MSIRFDGSDDNLDIGLGQNTDVLPVHFGFWVRPASIAGGGQFRAPFQIRSTAASGFSDYLDFTDAGGSWILALGEDGSGDLNTVSGPATGGDGTAGKWEYVVIGLTSDALNLSVLDWRGVITNATASAGTSMVGRLGRINLGARFSALAFERFFPGSIAEFWYSWSHFGDAAVGALTYPSAQEMRKLAFEGPFSLINVHAGLKLYRSFRAGVLGVHGPDAYDNSRGSRTFANTGSFPAEHPPLYARRDPRVQETLRRFRVIYGGIAGAAPQGLTATKFDNAQTFQTHVITKTVTLTATTFANTNTFFTQQLSVGPRTLTATKFDGAQTFFTHVLTVGSVTLAPTLFANAQSFPTHTLSAIYNLSATLFTDGDTFFTHTIDVGAAQLSPTLFANGQTFFTHALTVGGVTLAPTLFVNDQFFDSFVVSLGAGSQNVLPAKFDNAQSFFTATLSVGAVTLATTLFENGATFYTHALGAGLGPSLFEDGDSFFTHAISTSSTLVPAVFENAAAFYQHALALGLSAALYEDDDTFYPATLDQFLGINPELFENATEFFDAVIEIGGITLDVATFKNATTFYGHNVGSRQRFPAPRGGRSRFEVDETRRNDPRTSSRTWR